MVKELKMLSEHADYLGFEIEASSYYGIDGDIFFKSYILEKKKLIKSFYNMSSLDFAMSRAKSEASSILTERINASALENDKVEKLQDADAEVLRQWLISY
jgi:hypothetical protein